MPNISNNLKDFHPRFFREVVVVIGGMGFLLILNYLYRPDLKEVANINLIGMGGLYIIGLSLSYATGKILEVAGQFAFAVPYGLLSTLNMLANRKNILTYSKQRRHIYAQVLLNTPKYPEFGARQERVAYSRTFSSILFSSLLFLFFIDHLNFLLWPLLINFTYLAVMESNDSDMENEVISLIAAE